MAPPVGVVGGVVLLVVLVVGVVGVDHDNPWDGTWVKRGLRRPPYSPEQCGADFRQICEFSHSQKVNKYVWKPSKAYPFQWQGFDGEELQQCLAGKKIFMQGDSLIRNLRESMLCLSPPHAKETIIYDQNPFLCSPTPPAPLKKQKKQKKQRTSLFPWRKGWEVGVGVGGGGGGGRWRERERVNVYPEDVDVLLSLMDFEEYGMVLLGTGTWYTVPAFQNTDYYCEYPRTHQPCDTLKHAFPACLEKIKKFLEEKLQQHPGILFVWASKLPRHYVAEYTDERHCNTPNIPTKPWNSDFYENFRQKEQKIFEPLLKYPNFLFFDHYVMSQYRADGHPGTDRTLAFGGDCTHFCLPGVPDFWSAVLQQHYCYFSSHNHTVFYNQKHHQQQRYYDYH